MMAWINEGQINKSVLYVYAFIAGHDIDYGSGPYTITFPAGETSVQFNIVINDDNIVEGSEEFSLAIQRKSLPATVTRTKPGQTTITILDNDSKEFYL